MKIIISLLIGAILFTLTGGIVSAQKKKITVIIFRHAEKEEAVEDDTSEPDISIEGQKRAIRLVEVLEKYKPLQIFSTDYPRTIQTVTPLSRIRNLPIQFYEPGRMNEFVNLILSFKKKRRIAVVGHNATTWQLVNLLLKEDKYKMPPEADYGKIWIIRMKNGRVTDKVISY